MYFKSFEYDRLKTWLHLSDLVINENVSVSKHSGCK